MRPTLLLSILASFSRLAGYGGNVEDSDQSAEIEDKTLRVSDGKQPGKFPNATGSCVETHVPVLTFRTAAKSLATGLDFSFEKVVKLNGWVPFLDQALDIDAKYCLATSLD